LTGFRVKINGDVAAIDMAKKEARRKNPSYQQVSFYWPVELARTFKSYCTLKGVDMSEESEGMVQMWLDQTSPLMSVVSMFDRLSRKEFVPDHELIQIAHDTGVDIEVLKQARDCLCKNGGKQNARITD
jgi:hypothetical protein